MKATQLAPVQLAPRAVHGWILLCAGRLDDSERSLRETLELNPDYYLTNWFLGEALAQQGKLAAAIEVLRKARLLSTDAPRVMADLADVYGRQGQKDSARVILQQLLDASHGGHQISHYELAIARLGLGDAEGALRDLDAALAERTWQAANIMVDPMLQSLRLHPRFASLVRKAGLSPIW